MNYLLKDFKEYLIENEEKYKNGLRDSIEYQLGYTEVKEIVEEIERLNNIINTMLEFNLFAEECPLNFGYTERCNEEKAQDVFYEDDYCEKACNDDYKKCWLKYFERLQELKGKKKIGEVVSLEELESYLPQNEYEAMEQDLLFKD